MIADRLDRYALRLLVGPLAVVLTVLLVAQLLGRLLRLFDLVASAGAPLASVAVLFAELVPHYLGLTLPMAFTAAIFMMAARLSDDSELDVMLSSGRSIARIAAPAFALGIALVPFNVYLFGVLQPLTRYAYNAAVDATLATAWNARVEPNRFIGAGRGFVFSADTIDADGRHVAGVFVERRRDGVDEATTATRGEFTRGADGQSLHLRLEDGLTLRETRTGGHEVSRFAESRIEHDLLPEPKAERRRGESVRERTLTELWQSPRDAVDARKARAELHARLARIAVVPLLPLLALPLGIASKRGRRTPGVIFAGLSLLAVHHAIQFGQGLAEAGKVTAPLAVWTPFAVFALLSAWVFAKSLAWPGDNPVVRAVAAIDAALDGLKPLRWRRAAVAGRAAS